MEGFIARSYDKNARKMQMGIYKDYLNSILHHVKDGDSILEIASGPGYLAIELSKMGKFKITGLDISHTFVEIAQDNAKKAMAEISFQQADVANMPFLDSSFDFILCTSAFKNFSDPVKALNEMHRVLKPNGKVWIDDLRKDFTNESIDNLIKNKMKAKGFSAFFMKWSFKSFLKKSAYTREQFENFASTSRFKNYEIVETPTEFELLLTK